MLFSQVNRFHMPLLNVVSINCHSNHFNIAFDISGGETPEGFKRQLECLRKV